MPDETKICAAGEHLVGAAEGCTCWCHKLDWRGRQDPALELVTVLLLVLFSLAAGYFLGRGQAEVIFIPAQAPQQIVGTR